MLFEEYNVEIALQVKADETREETKETIAIKMLKKGYTIDVIQSITDLPTERIMELEKQLDLQPVNS